MSPRVTVPVLERSRMEKASRMGRRCWGARRERGSEGMFVVLVLLGVIVDVDVDENDDDDFGVGVGAGAVGRGLLPLLLPVLSGAGVATSL